MDEPVNSVTESDISEIKAELEHPRELESELSQENNDFRVLSSDWALTLTSGYSRIWKLSPKDFSINSR